MRLISRIQALGVLVAALAFTVGGAGCLPQPRSFDNKSQSSPLDSANTEKHKALVAEGDALWKERGDEAKLRATIAKWEEAVQVKPDDWDTYYKLTRATYILADGFLSFDTSKVDEFLMWHEKGIAYGEKGLMAYSPDVANKVNQGIKLEEAIQTVDMMAVPLLYWYDVNLGKWAKFKGLTTSLQHRDRIFKVMTKVYELNPDYFYGAPDRYFGGYFSVAPAFAGGDLVKARQYFDNSLKKEFNYLATHVLIAELYAPKVQDRALYERELKYVLDTPAEVLPDLVPENLNEKKKAAILLQQIDEKF